MLGAAGRIDNRDALVARLGVPGPAGTVSDADLMLAAYRRWGEQCAHELLGDFAFVLWDAERQYVFAARDPMGVQPFYYWWSPASFACASEARALLALPEVDAVLDPVGVAAALLPRIQDGETTLVRNLRRLPGGHTLTVDGRGTVCRRYWRLDPDRELRFPSPAASAEALRAVLAEAVRCRLPSSLPVGSMLSGGLDSSAVTALARDLRRQDGAGPLPTVSVTFAHTGTGDERPWIDRLLAGGGLEPHFVPWSGCLVPDPQTDLARFSTHILVNDDAFRASAAAGIQVVLSGEGGDEALSTGHLALGSPWTLLRAGEWRAGMERLYRIARRRGRSLLRPVGTEPAERTLLLPDLRQTLAVAERQEAYLRRWQRSTPRAQHAARLEATGQLGVPEALAATARRHNVDVRTPFWDRRVLEFCLALPTARKERGRLPRAVLREAMEGLLPPEVQWRQGKWPAHPVLGPAFRRLRDESTVLPGTAPPLAELLDVAAVEQTWAALDRPEAAATAVIQCWRLAALAAQVEAYGLRL